VPPRWIAGILTGILVIGAIGWLAFYRSERGGVQTETVNTREDWQDRLVRLAATHAQPNFGGRTFWPFAKLQGEATAMSPTFRRVVISTLGGHQHLGLRFGEAHYLDTRVDVGIWVVKGDGVTCIFEADKGASACATDSVIVERGLEIVVGEGPPSPDDRTLPSRFLALGIAPDSVKAVRLKAVGGNSTTIPVVENAYGYRAAAPIRREALIR
jgi:hypothetical protein